MKDDADVNVDVNPELDDDDNNDDDENVNDLRKNVGDVDKFLLLLLIESVQCWSIVLRSFNIVNAFVRSKCECDEEDNDDGDSSPRRSSCT